MSEDRKSKCADFYPVVLIWTAGKEFGGEYLDVIRDPQFLREVERGILQVAKTKSNELPPNTPVPLTDSKVSTILKDNGRAALSKAHEEAKTLPAYSSAMKCLSDVKERFDNSSEGIFIDRNKGWIIAVASVLAVGGVFHMYRLRRGDVLAKAATLLANGSGVGFNVGSFQLSLRGFEFLPTQRFASVTIDSTFQWESMQFDGSVVVEYHEGTTIPREGSGALMIPLSEKTKLKTGGKYKDNAERGSQETNQSYEAFMAISRDYTKNLNVSIGTQHTWEDTGNGPVHESQVFVGIDYRFHCLLSCK